VIVLDASVLIAQFELLDAHHDAAVRLFASWGAGRKGASPITLAEVLVAPAARGEIKAAVDALRRLAIAAVPIDDDAPVRLAQLRAATGLKLPDCCVLLAAEQNGGTLATFDARLAAAARDRGLTVLDPPTPS